MFINIASLRGIGIEKRDPVESFINGVVPRMLKNGRVILISTNIETHANSLDNIK